MGRGAEMERGPAGMGRDAEIGRGAAGMSRDAGMGRGAGIGRDACRRCLRRVWLLSKLSVRLDFRSRDEGRLLDLLALGDEELIEAIAGRRRREVREQWQQFTPDTPFAGARTRARTAGVETVCRHDPRYPPALGDSWPEPGMLHVLGGRRRLASLTASPTVAIAGSATASDYGMEMAHSLAHDLAACGVTIVAGFANGIAAAAHSGALQAGGKTVTVMAGGVDVVAPASRRGLYERVSAHGCAVAEAPCGVPARRWRELARSRAVAGLATLTIVVEAGASPSELRAARLARTLGRTVAAVPGRVTSPVSTGTNALLAEGAPLVRGPSDALDLLYGCDPRSAERERRPAPPRAPELEPRLRTMLERVGAGRDTPGKLTAPGEDPGETLLALSELEILGLLGRGDGGRYVPCASLSG